MTLAPVAPVAPPLLSALLRDGTRTEHEQAESQAFVTRLVAGDLSIPAYACLAAQQHAIYTALEEASALISTDERGASLVFPELTRVPSIERDLEHLYGTHWRETVHVMPSTKQYVARLHDVGSLLPEYAAHAWTRYLGDLSGGQVIKRMMQRHYGMDSAGLEFYDFPQIPKAKPFKELYRARLDSLMLNDAETARAIAEAQRAFRLNRAMFADLGTACA